MVDSPFVAAFLARWAFWVLLGVGWLREALGPKGIVIFLLSWIAGLVGFQYASSPYDGLFSPYVAALDVALVFAVFKGDVRLT
jgi:hypothetical protein